MAMATCWQRQPAERRPTPQWIRNLGAAGQASIRIREHQYDVDARVTESGERDELWKNVILTRAPSFARYEEKSGLTIPIAR
jgi:deazaflavin-dependent oxidoreductase (nitroreductase family)